MLLSLGCDSNICKFKFKCKKRMIKGSLAYLVLTCFFFPVLIVKFLNQQVYPSTVEWWPSISLCWIRGCWMLAFPLGLVSTWSSVMHTFYSCITPGNQQQQRWTPRDAGRTTHSEEMVCDEESSAAKGFYSPFKLVSCLNTAYMEKSQWYFECVCIIS